MALFSKPFFKSSNPDIEVEYAKGVSCLSEGDTTSASRHFVTAMRGGHVSATYNLCMIWGSGVVSPYDFDAAADCWYKAASAGHPKAKQSLWLIEAADRGGFGTDILADFTRKQGSGNGLSAAAMICAARFFDVLCRKYGATADVIAYELDGASNSEWKSVQSFLQRTGLDHSFYKGGLNRVLENSAADQITDGLDQFSSAMLEIGFHEKIVAMARCSIVGYVVRKSAFGERALPLLGVDTFFSDEEEISDQPMHPMLREFAAILDDPKSVEWFSRVAYGWDMGLPADVGLKVNSALRMAGMISLVSSVSATDLADAADDGDFSEVNQRLNGGI
jgi:hypothetical protein